MSKVENVNFDYICDLPFQTGKQFIKHNLIDGHLNIARKEYEGEVEDETSERVYNSDEDDYVLKPKTIAKDNTKKIIKSKRGTKAKTKTEDGPEAIREPASPMLRHTIYTRIKYECKECHEDFRNKIAVTTNTYSHNRKYLENTEYFDINSSQNMKEFYITDKAGNYTKDIDEATNNSLEEIKNCYQYGKGKSFKCKITAECEYKKRTKGEIKTTKIFFNTDYIINNARYEKGDFTQWLNFEKEIYEGYGYDFEFLRIKKYSDKY